MVAIQLSYAFRPVGGGEVTHQRKLGNIGDSLRPAPHLMQALGRNPSRFMPLFTFR